MMNWTPGSARVQVAPILRRTSLSIKRGTELGTSTARSRVYHSRSAGNNLASRYSGHFGRTPFRRAEPQVSAAISPVILADVAGRH